MDSAENLRFFFNDIADQISGQQYIYIRIACPVDVKVTCNGETLDSSEESLNTRTDFGTLTFEESGEDQSEETDTGQDAYEDTGQSGALFGILNQTQNGDDREEETDDRIKVLRLKDNTEYDIEIEGTARVRWTIRSVSWMTPESTLISEDLKISILRERLRLIRLRIVGGYLLKC